MYGQGKQRVEERALCIHTATYRLSDHSHVVGVTSKAGYVLLDPDKRSTLIAQSIVSFITCRAKFLGAEESWSTQAITVYVCVRC